MQRGHSVADKIKFVFIATADGPEFEDAATSRTLELCRELYNSRLDKNARVPAPTILRFIRFDLNSNTIKLFEFTLAKAATPTPPTGLIWVPLTKFVASGDPRYSPAKFLDTGAAGALLNILHIYHSIRGAPAESVLELSIYSHGWMEGPIIRRKAHSNDDKPPPPVGGLPRRKPNDTDGRMRTDFEDNMGEDPNLGSDDPDVFPRTGGKNAFKEFKNAFDKKAVLKICGCNGLDIIRDKGTNKRIALLKSTAGQIVHQVYVIPTRANEDEKDKKTKSDSAKLGAIWASGKHPTGLIDIDMGAEFSEERDDVVIRKQHYEMFDSKDRAADNRQRLELHYNLDTKFFPPVKKTDGHLDVKQETKFKRSFESVQGAVARRMKETYSFKAASKLGITVIAGPVGTRSGPIGKQMQVCGEKSKNESDCWRSLGFFERFMDLDRDKRNYFVFDKEAVDNINALAEQ